MTGSAVEIAPRRAGEVATPPGHQVYWEECFTCHRDFRIYVPAGLALSALVQDVPCPHCHRSQAEVRIEFSELPILVEPTQCSWVGWRVRRARQLARTVRRTISIRAGQALRQVARWFSASPEGP